MQLEAALMPRRSTRRPPVAEVVVDDDGSTLGTAGLVMDHVDGESLPRQVLADEQFADARRVLVGQVGAFLAGLHAIDPDDVPGLTHSDVLADMWAVYDLVGGGSPVFEKTQAWLEANRPATTAPTIVHGDLRLGNLIVDRGGLAVVIDWELAHLGDSLRTWRGSASRPGASAERVRSPALGRSTSWSPRTRRPAGRPSTGPPCTGGWCRRRCSGA